MSYSVYDIPQYVICILLGFTSNARKNELIHSEHQGQ